MDKKDSFNRIYPVLGFIPFLIIAVAPAIAAFACGVSSVTEVFTDKTLLQTVAYSVLLALGCTLASLALGLPGAYIMTSYRFPTKGFFKGLFLFSALLPSTVIALFPRVLIGEYGYISALTGTVLSIPFPWLETGILLTVFNIPVVVVIVNLWWSRMDHSIENTAVTLGTGRFRIFSSLTMPRLRRSIAASAAFVFVRSFSSIAVVLSISEAPFINTATSMYILSSAGDVGRTGALALFNFAVSVLAIIPFISLFKGEKEKISQKAKQRRMKGFSAVLSCLYLLLSFIILVAPVAATLFRSMRDASGFNFSSYETLFGGLEAPGTKAGIYSLMIALVSAIVSTFISLRLSKASYYHMAFIPLALGSAVVGFGYSVLSARFSMVPSLVYAILAHVSIAVPFAVILIRPSMKGIPGNLDSTSMTLGYSSAYSFRNIDRKLIGRSVFAAFLVSVAISLGEFGTSLFLNGKTLPVLLFNTEDVQSACALASILVFIDLILLLISASLLRGGKGRQNV